MAKINREEYEVLKGLDDAWKWIARDKNGGLYKFQEKPKKVDSFRWNDRNQTWLGMSGDRFQFIQWEDGEAHNIAELTEEYEIKNGMRYDFGKIKVVDIDTSKLATHNGYIYVKESEETELKDIKWANKEIEKARDLLNNKRYEEEVDDFTTGVLSGLKKALDILDQLDEPETLSQEWLVEHSYNVHLLGTPDVEIVAVPRDDLEGLLVPKKELPEDDEMVQR